jgi:hypothetical protein
VGCEGGRMIVCDSLSETQYTYVCTYVCTNLLRGPISLSTSNIFCFFPYNFSAVINQKWGGVDDSFLSR